VLTAFEAPSETPVGNSETIDKSRKKIGVAKDHGQWNPTSRKVR